MNPEGDGVVRDTLGTVAGTAGMKREMKIYRIVAMFLLVLIIVVFIGMFAAVFLAVEASREVATSHGQLTDTSGRGISTSQKHDSMHGIKATSSRRLANVSRRLSTGHLLEIPATVFYQARDNFTKGATKFVVPIPDGYALTIQIKGWGASSAWGKCLTCDVNSIWTVSCPVQRMSLSSSPESMCQVAMTHQGQRELQERSLQGGASFGGDDDHDAVRALPRRRRRHTSRRRLIAIPTPKDAALEKAICQKGCMHCY